MAAVAEVFTPAVAAMRGERELPAWWQTNIISCSCWIYLLLSALLCLRLSDVVLVFLESYCAFWGIVEQKVG